MIMIPKRVLPFNLMTHRLKGELNSDTAQGQEVSIADLTSGNYFASTCPDRDFVDASDYPEDEFESQELNMSYLDDQFEEAIYEEKYGSDNQDDKEKPNRDQKGGDDE